MSTKYSNVSSVPLSLGVFLATDTYDYSTDPSHISATSLLKPARQLILSNRVPLEDAVVDISQIIAPKIGSAIHDAIESSWLNNYAQAMKNLGYPESVIKQVKINPENPDDCIPVYLERRAFKQVGAYTISGKFDIVIDGRVEDFKSTSTYTAMNGSKDEDYILQGSIYRWLNPEIITEDTMAIQFIFTDWSKAKAIADPKYPQQRFQTNTYQLLSLQETERFIHKKLSELDRYKDVAEPELPLCTDTELWRSKPVYKYYKNPSNTNRSTKNFATKQEAYIRMAEDGNVGIVREVPGQVGACKYCPAFTVCTQKDSLIASGDLVI